MRAGQFGGDRGEDPAAVTVATVAEPVATRMSTATTQARNSTDRPEPCTASAMT